MGGNREQRPGKSSGLGSVKSVLERLLGRGRHGAGENPKQPLAGFVGAETFEHLLLKEKARADRAGSAFAVVVFETARWTAQAGGADALQILGDVMVERVRLSDTLGWFGKNLGVLVPDADGDGAEAIARDVRGLFQDQRSSLNGHSVSFAELQYITYLYDGSAASKEKSSKAALTPKRVSGSSTDSRGDRNVRSR